MTSANEVRPTAVGYVRQASGETGLPGLGIDEQEAALRAAAQERGWTLRAIHRDACDESVEPFRRPGMKAVLANSRHDASAAGFMNHRSEPMTLIRRFATAAKLPWSASTQDEESKTIKLLLIAGVIVLLDQFTKMLVLRYLPLYDSVAVIPGFFDLTHVQNPGGAFIPVCVRIRVCAVWCFCSFRFWPWV